MSIKKDVTELQNINAEIRRLYKSIKQLRDTKAVVERRISDYLEREEMTAIKDSSRGVIVKLNKESKKVFAAPKKSRIQESISILQMAGVKDAEEILTKLKDVGKNTVEKKVLKLNNYTN